MYKDAAKILINHKDIISKTITEWVKDNYPNRTDNFEKCSRDISHIIKAVSQCLHDDDYFAIDSISAMFFRGDTLQLASTHTEFEAYDLLLKEIEKILINCETGSIEYCHTIIKKLKINLQYGVALFWGKTHMYRETKKKHNFYAQDCEREIIKNMQKCQRNWDYSKRIHPEYIDYLLWHAENAPSKQHEGYYDVYWTADRKVIEECTKYTWGSTHSKNPPSTWRNSQANANLYILFVAKEPHTTNNCHVDGSEKLNTDPARWENAYVCVGIAMGLVMRAAHSLSLSTGCNKSHGDINGNKFWEKKLGILDDVQAGKKRIAYGIGIGYPQKGRPRWETDETELCIGAANGHNLTTYNEDDLNYPGEEFRKCKIVDIRDTDTEVDPYGNIHQIPNSSDTKINSHRSRNINIIEIK